MDKQRIKYSSQKGNDPNLCSLTGKNLRNIMLSNRQVKEEYTCCDSIYTKEKTSSVSLGAVDIKTITKSKRMNPKFRVTVALGGEVAERRGTQ